MGPAVVRGEVGARKRLDNELADAFAVGTATRPGREPAHDLAHVPGGPGTGGRDRLPDEAADLVLGQGLGKVGGEDLDLRFFLGREVLAPAGPECLDGLAAGLHLATEDGEELVLGQRVTVAFLDVVGGTGGHARG